MNQARPSVGELTDHPFDLRSLSLQARLQGFRKKIGLTPAQLAKQISVSPAIILRWENGTARPSAGQAARLLQIGLPISEEDTNAAEVPRLGVVADASEEGIQRLREVVRSHITVGGRPFEFSPAPYVFNGPKAQVSLFERLYDLQSFPSATTDESRSEAARRLSAVTAVLGLVGETSQARLEQAAWTEKHWNPNYGPHGWHRYIGR